MTTTGLNWARVMRKDDTNELTDGFDIDLSLLTVPEINVTTSAHTGPQFVFENDVFDKVSIGLLSTGDAGIATSSGIDISFITSGAGRIFASANFLPSAALLTIGDLTNKWRLLHIDMPVSVAAGVRISDSLDTKFATFEGFTFLGIPVGRFFVDGPSSNGLFQNVAFGTSHALVYNGGNANYSVLENAFGGFVHFNLIETGEFFIRTKGMDYTIEGNATDILVVTQTTAGDTLTYGIGGPFGAGASGFVASSGVPFNLLTVGAALNLIAGFGSPLLIQATDTLTITTSLEVIWLNQDVPMYWESGKLVRMELISGDDDFELDYQDAGSSSANYIIMANGVIGMRFDPDLLSIETAYAVDIETFTSDDTLDGTNHSVLLDGSANTVTATLPTAVGIQGIIYSIKCIDDTFTTDVDPNGSETIDGDSANFVLIQDEEITVQSDNSNWQLIY